MKPVLIHFTEELWEVIDSLRNGESRSAWLEKQARRIRTVKDKAVEMGITFRERPRRGTYDRSPLRGLPRGTTLVEAKKKRKRKK